MIDPPPSPHDPIRAYFVLDQVPQGEAPLTVREAWVGLSLPLRYDRAIESPDPATGVGVVTRTRVPIEDAVFILVTDAVRALLAADHLDAARYWQAVWKRSTTPVLAFRAHEGRILPPDLARLLDPDLDR